MHCWGMIIYGNYLHAVISITAILQLKFQLASLHTKQSAEGMFWCVIGVGVIVYLNTWMFMYLH